MIRTHIVATWSRLANDRQLRLHQELALQAFINGATCVIDTARTGDGKTMAALLCGAEHGRRMLMVYPTRELMQDQLESLQRLQEQKNLMAGHTWQIINSDTLDEAQAAAKETEQDLSRSRAIRDMVLRRRTNWITSPDLLDQLLDQRYAGGQGDAKDIGELIANHVGTLVIDEFHLYDQIQVHKILLCIAHLRTFNPDLRVLLLSATATPEITGDLKKIGMNVEEVTGEYLDQDHNPGPEWQMILQPVTLSWTPQPPDTTADWLESIAPELKDHLDNQNSRLLCIFGSLREASLARYSLSQMIGMTAQHITGLTRKEERKAARESGRLVVATSTVDVGVDFKISGLAFQAWDHASFIQRFGRLGRGTPQTDHPACEAWTNINLELGPVATRAELYAAAARLGSRRQGWSYRVTWGRSLNGLRRYRFACRRNNKKGQLDAMFEQLKALGGWAIEKGTGGQQVNMPAHLRNPDGTAIALTRPGGAGADARVIEQGLLSFRQAPGGKEVMMQDLDGQWHRYDLIRAIRLAEISFLDSPGSKLPHIRIERIRTEPIELKLKHAGTWYPDYDERPRREGPMVLRGLSLDSTDPNFKSWQARINQAMESATLLALPIPEMKSSAQARSHFGLGPQGDIRVIQDIRNQEMLCACGQAAFLADWPDKNREPTRQEAIVA